MYQDRDGGAEDGGAEGDEGDEKEKEDSGDESGDRDCRWR